MLGPSDGVFPLFSAYDDTLKNQMQSVLKFSTFAMDIQSAWNVLIDSKSMHQDKACLSSSTKVSNVLQIKLFPY